MNSGEPLSLSVFLAEHWTASLCEEDILSGNRVFCRIINNPSVKRKRRNFVQPDSGGDPKGKMRDPKFIPNGKTFLCQVYRATCMIFLPYYYYISLFIKKKKKKTHHASNRVNSTKTLQQIWSQIWLHFTSRSRASLSRVVDIFSSYEGPTKSQKPKLIWFHEKAPHYLFLFLFFFFWSSPPTTY